MNGKVLLLRTREQRNERTNVYRKNAPSTQSGFVFFSSFYLFFSRDFSSFFGMLICENLYCSGFPLSFMRNRMIIIMAILFQHHQELSIMTFSLCCRFFVPPSSFCGCLFVGAKACSGLLLFALAWWERGDCRTKGALGIHSSNSSCSNRVVFLGGGRNRLPLPPRGCSFFASSMAFSMSPCISCSLYPASSPLQVPK